MRAIATIALAILGFIGVPAPSAGQALGAIAGAVKDASGAVLPGVMVEAGSPALIEKVRTVVTDGSGQYQIVSLPPGVYTVTFTLAGFSTVKREAIDVSINFTAAVNAELKVGAVAETITVTGETPVVDIQSATQQRTLTSTMFKDIPTSGVWIQLATLVAGVNTTTRDVGGSSGDTTGAQVSAHGGLPGDGVTLLDGLRVGNMYLSSNVSNMSFSPLLFDEVDISVSGQTGESGTNGVLANMIPKSGGNAFHGSLLANGSGAKPPVEQHYPASGRSRPRGRAFEPQEAVRRGRRDRWTDQAEQAVVLFHVPVLHERGVHCRVVLPGRSGGRHPRGGQRPPGQPGHVDEGCQPAADLGARLRSRRFPRGMAISGSRIRSGRSTRRCRRKRHASRTGTPSWARSRGPTLRRTVCSSRRAIAPGASPDTILAQPDRSAGIPIVEQGGGVNPLAKPMTYRSAISGGHVRQRAAAKLQGVGELRDRDAHDEVRDGPSARALQPEQLCEHVQRHPAEDARLRPEPGHDFRPARGIHEPG